MTSNDESLVPSRFSTPNSLTSISPGRPPSTTAVPLRFPRAGSRRVRSYSFGDEDPRFGTRARGESLSRLSRRSTRIRRKRKPPLALVKRAEYVTSLAKSIDSLVFMQLATLYYLECNFLLLAPRAFLQYLYLTPQNEPMAGSTAAVPNLLALFAPNILALLWHIFSSPPIGAESNHGYLHGGLIIDFIGQIPPTSKLVFVTLDVFIFILQCMLLAIHLERDELRCQIDPKNLTGSVLLRRISRMPTLDQAERGAAIPLPDVSGRSSRITQRMWESGRGVPSPNNSAAERETSSQSMSNLSPPEDGAIEENTETLLSVITGADNREQGNYDEIISGLAIIGNFNLFQSIRIYTSIIVLQAALQNLTTGEHRVAVTPSSASINNTEASTEASMTPSESTTGSWRDRIQRLQDLRANARLGRALRRGSRGAVERENTGNLPA